MSPPDVRTVKIPRPQRAAPEPLRRPVPPAEDYPLDALGDILGPAAKRIHQVVQAPDALCGQSILAAASLAVQSHADVLIEGRREPLSLWAVSIAESGERKSAVDQVALAPHKQYERVQLQRYADDKADFAIASLAFETASRSVNKGKDPAAIKSALLDLGSAPETPINPMLLVTTPTIEGIHRLYKNGQPSIGLFHDDAGEFIGGHAMNKDNRTKSVSGLSRLWDCGEFDRVRSGDGAEKFFGRRFAMHLMMQPVIAESILGDDILTGQGFLARSLLAWPSSTIGSRLYVDIDLSTDSALAAYRSRIADHLQTQPPLREDSRNELEPRSLVLEAQAKILWTSIHNALERDMRDGGDFASIRAWAGKAPAQILRIAGVLTLMADPDAGVIHTDALDQAAKLMAFSLAEAVRVIGTSQVPTEIRHAEALLCWCHLEQTKFLHSGAALQFGPNVIRSKRAFDNAIIELERAGWAVPVDGGCEIDGKHRRRVWAILEAE